MSFLGPHHWCVHRAQILHTPVLGVNLQPGEEWTTLDDWATGVSSWAVASSTADLDEAFKIWAIFFAKWMTKIGIDHPVEVVSRTSVATAQASVLFVNSVETCHFCKKPGLGMPFSSIPKAVRNVCHQPVPGIVPPMLRIHPIHPPSLLPGCPFF